MSCPCVRLGAAVVAAAASALSGCAAPAPFYVDEACAAYEADIQSAADEWAAATNGRAVFDFVWGYRAGTAQDDHRRVIECVGADRLVDSLTDHLGYTGHVTFPIGGAVMSERITLWPARIAAAGVPLRDIILHELGHAAGIRDHIDAPGAIMRSEEGADSDTLHCVTYADLGAFCDQADTCRARPLEGCVVAGGAP